MLEDKGQAERVTDKTGSREFRRQYKLTADLSSEVPSTLAQNSPGTGQIIRKEFKCETGYSSLVRHRLKMCKALGSVPQQCKKKRKQI
jgi:hypothetical protein